MKNLTALYCRVSTDDKQDITMQINDLNAYASTHGRTNLKFYTDEGISGSKSKRPALDSLMEDCRKGLIKSVIVWRLDRMGRSIAHLVVIADEFQKLGIEFISLKESIDTATPAGQLFYHLIAAFAQYERAIIIERVKAGLANAKRKGKKLGKKPLSVDIEEVRQMKSTGLTIRDIAKKLGTSTSPIMRILRTRR